MLFRSAGDFDPDDPDLDTDPDPPSEPESDPYIGVVPDPNSCPSSIWFDLPRKVRLRTSFVLHLFSGQRRTDDFQFHFEACLQSSPLPAICLSVDIVHHRRVDLTDPKSLALWIDLILLRIVWSIASLSTSTSATCAWK